MAVSNNNRVGGLATGIDTDTIVKDLMKIRRAPLDKLAQDKQVYEWQRDDYRNINSALRSFRDKTSTMKLQSTYMANVASTSNGDAVTATASTNAGQGTYSVSVTQLAQGVSKGSQATLAEELKADGSIKSLKDQFGLTDDPITFTLTGKFNGELKSQAFTIEPGSKSIIALAAEINGANIGIRASYDSNLNRFFLTATGTGSNAYIKVAGDSSQFLSDATGAGTGTLKLKFTNDADPSLANGQLGKDAIFDMGDMTGITSATNTPKVNGITLNLKKEGAAATISVSRDTDAVFNSVVDFINNYNSTIGTINDKLSEVRYKNYKPLTDSQKEEMSEKEIEKWEGYAKSGLLKNDPILSSAVSKVRSSMSAVVSGLAGYNSLSRIGISTVSWQENGKLYVNESDLREAINTDPEAVMNLFTKTSSVSSEKGIAQRLYDEVNRQIETITNKAGFASTLDLYDDSIIGEKIDYINDRMDALQIRLNEAEDRYYRQFTAMEKAISRMNAQSSWLSQQFSTGS